MLFDPLYLALVLPGLVLGLWAGFKVKRTFSHYAEVGVRSAMSGAEVAREMIRRHQISGVRVEEHEGFLSDHYDPRERVVRLSPDVYHGRTVSAVGVAAHECGHVLQHAQHYAPMTVRQTLVWPATLGSTLSMILIVAGFALKAAGLIWVGILAFSAVVLFQLVTLPVEFNASSRARAALLQLGIVSQSEDRDVAKVLNAAALTYVAALITAVLQLVYFVIRATSSKDD